jgi:predicted RNA-binding protein with TRAM domain
VTARGMCEASSLMRKVADWRHRLQAAHAGSPHSSRTNALVPHRYSSPQHSTSAASAPHRPCCKHSSSPGPRHTTRVAAAAAGHADAAAAPPRAAPTAAQPKPGTGAAAALSVGDVVQVTCDRLGTGGVGVCLFGPSQLVLLVKGALPGEQLTAAITAVKKSE